MPFLIQTRDKPGHAHLRASVRAVHLDYLEAHKDKLLAAGALLEDDGSVGEGGVLIVDFETREAAEAFAENDPFTKAGLFAAVTITRWRKAYFNFQNCL
jgi:uncharacterized protein